MDVVSHDPACVACHTGQAELASIQRLDVGLGFESVLAVVMLAIILDRITESFGGAPRNR